MIQNDEALSPSSGSGVDDCVKCGTSYSSRVEWVQHLLLHIERTYPVVTLNRDEAVKFPGVTDNKNKMSSEGETEMNQVDEVETKPKVNNIESHGDSNNVSSTKDEGRESISGDDDSMSICSSTGAPANAPPEVPKMVIKAEVHAPDAETAPSEEANGRRSSESSQGKGQSGAEDEDDGKTSDGSKSPAKPTTPSLPFAITVRKSEDLMAQTNYNLIQKRLQELYSRCQGTRTQDSQPVGLSHANASAGGHVGSSVRAFGSRSDEVGANDRNAAGSSQKSRMSQDQQASNVQSGAAHSSSNANETRDDNYDSTPKLSECGTECSGEINLTPTVNAEIDAVLKDIDFSRLPDDVDDGVDSDNDMTLRITSEDCDWPDEIEEQPDNHEDSGTVAEPPSPPKPKKIGPKPKISDYFAVARKSGSNTKSPIDDIQFPKKEPRNAPEKVSSKRDKEMSIDNEVDDYNLGSPGVTNSQGFMKNSNPEATSRTVTPRKRYTSFEGVLDDENPKDDHIDESRLGHNRRKSMPATNIRHVPTGSIQKSVSAGLIDPRTTGASTISKQPRSDSMLNEGSRWDRNEPRNTHRTANSSMRTQQKCGDLKSVMTDRCGAGSQNSMKSAEYRQLRPILTDTSVKERQTGNRNATYQETADNHNQADGLRRDVANLGRIQSNMGTSNSGRNLRSRPQSSMATDFSSRPNLDREALSNPTDSSGLPPQNSGTSMDASYVKVTRNLGHGISLSVAPPKNDQHSSDQEVCGKASTHQGMKGADISQTGKLGRGGTNPRKARSNEVAMNSGRNEQIRPPSKMAADSCDDHNPDKGTTRNLTKHDRLSQSDTASVIAGYDQDARDSSHEISVSSLASMNNQRMNDQEMQVSSRSHRGVPAANCNQISKIERGGSNLGQARSTKSAMNSGRNAINPPQSSVAADFKDDPNSNKEAISNPTAVDHRTQSDSANVISGYDQDTRNSSHEISVSSLASMNNQRMNDQEMQVSSRSHRGVPAANYNQISKIERGGSNLGQARSTKSAMNSGRNAVYPPQSSVAADFKDDPNSNKEAISNPTAVDRRTQSDSANVISGYDQNTRNSSLEISMSFASMNKHPLTEKEVDDIIASALQGRSGMTISKTTSVDQQFPAGQEPRSQSSGFELDVSRPKGHSGSIQLDHQGLESVDLHSVADKRQSRQPSGSRSGDVGSNQRSRRAKKTNRKTAPDFEYGDPVFEAQPATDYSSDVGSQTVLPTVNRKNPALASADIQESKDLDSDSSVSEIKIPNLPPFFETFPSVSTSVVGKTFGDVASAGDVQRAAASQENPGPLHVVPGPPHVVCEPPHPMPATSKATRGTFKQPARHKLPPPAPAPGPLPRVAVPIQRPNKINATKKYRPMLSDSDSSGSFEVKNKSKSVAQDSSRSSTNPPVKVSEGEKWKPQDFMDGLFPTGLSPPKPLTPVSVSTLGSFTPGKSYTNLQPFDNSFYQDPSDTAENPSHPYPSQLTVVTALKEDFTNGDFRSSQKDLYRCALCPRSFVTAAELDAHTAAEGHIICSMSEACASLSFDSLTALSHHQGMVHQAPVQATAVQRLAAQVERLPQTFGSYPPQGPPQPYGGPSPYSLSPTSYNGPKLGSQVVLTPMSSAVAPPPQPPPNLPNLPGIQVTKRPAPPPVDSSPSKMNRGDNGMPSIRLPDSITLVKSQPAPPPQNAVADMLATRGITVSPEYTFTCGNILVESF